MVVVAGGSFGVEDPISWGVGGDGGLMCGGGVEGPIVRLWRKPACLSSLPLSRCPVVSILRTWFFQKLTPWAFLSL